MDIRINNMDIRLNTMDMFIDSIKTITPTGDILFRLDPATVYGDPTCGGINDINTVSTFASEGGIENNIVYSPYSWNGKTYYNSITNELMEAPVRMDNLNFTLDKNQTIHSWINIKAPLKRLIYDIPESQAYARMKSGNVLYFYQGGGYNRSYTVGYKCPYYLVDGEPANKYLYNVFQFVIGISQKCSSDRKFIITDFAYSFDTWYLLSYVNDNNTLRLYVNGQPVKIFLALLNPIDSLWANHYYKSTHQIHNDIITQAGYGNNGLENLEYLFDYVVKLKKDGILSDKTGSKPINIQGFSTGALNAINTSRNKNRKYNKTNPFVDNGLIEIYNGVKTELEIQQYYTDTNIY